MITTKPKAEVRIDVKARAKVVVEGGKSKRLKLQIKTLAASIILGFTMQVVSLPYLSSSQSHCLSVN